MPQNHKVLAFAMAGGDGSRLHPLTAGQSLIEHIAKTGAQASVATIPVKLEPCGDFGIVDQDNDVPPRERIGFDLTQDRQRFLVTESGIVVVPASYFQPRAAANPFLSPDEPAEPGAGSVAPIEVLM